MKISLLIMGSFGFIAVFSTYASMHDQHGLALDITYGHYHTVMRVVPRIISPDTIIAENKTPLEFAKWVLQKSNDFKRNNNIRLIIKYLESLGLKQKAYKASYVPKEQAPKTLWDKLTDDIKYGRLWNVYSIVPVRVKLTDTDSQGRTPLDIALSEFKQPHRFITKKNIKAIIIYFNNLSARELARATNAGANKNPHKGQLRKKIAKSNNGNALMPVVMPATIAFSSVDKPYYELANGYPISGGIIIDNISWPTLEHYFQAQKFKDERVKDRILHAPSLQTVNAIVQQNATGVDPNWYKIPTEPIEVSMAHMPMQEQVMWKALRAKFNKEPFKDLLLDIDNAYLEYDNSHDSFWGASGANMLGKILMHIRSELQAGALLQFEGGDGVTSKK